MPNLCSRHGFASVDILRWKTDENGNQAIDLAPSDARSARRLGTGSAVLWVRHYGTLEPIGGRIDQFNLEGIATLTVERVQW